MTGRNQVPVDDHRLHNRLHRHPSTILEDRIAIQHREIQTLVVDNQQLTAAHLSLKQDLARTEDELRCLSAAASNVKAQRDDQVREVYERSLKLDAEVRSIDALRGELTRVRADIEKLTVHRQELSAELRVINGDLAKAKAEAEQVTEIKAEIQTMQKEIQRGRAAIEYEKKLYASNLEHGQTMKQNMVAVGREIEKFRAELEHAEKRVRVEASAAKAANPSPGYAGSYSNPEVSYGGTVCLDPYAVYQAQSGNEACRRLAPG